MSNLNLLPSSLKPLTLDLSLQALIGPEVSLFLISILYILKVHNEDFPEPSPGGTSPTLSAFLLRRGVPEVLGLLQQDLDSSAKLMKLEPGAWMIRDIDYIYGKSEGTRFD